MTEKYYKVVADNLGEYSVLRPDDSIVSTEIQNKAEAELFCDELNELLKELKVYRNIARCSNCKYHNYDWFDDGDEFEVCDKGNDVTEGICKDWEEIE